MSETILVVDDEQKIIDLARMYLEQDGYRVTCATDGESARRQIMEDTPNLVVLDLMLPGMDGLEVCRKVRAESDVPIIMLTARADDIDKIVGLELGADDYLTKPFNPRELVARIRAILRRTDRTGGSSDAPSPIVVRNLRIDAQRHTVEVAGKAVDLRMKEFDLLQALAENVGVYSAASDSWMSFGGTTLQERPEPSMCISRTCGTNCRVWTLASRPFGA